MRRLPLAASMVMVIVFTEGVTFGQPPQLFLPLAESADVEDDAEKLLEPKLFSRGTLVALNTAALLEGDGPVETEISIFGLDSKTCNLTQLESPSDASKVWHGVFDGGHVTLALRRGAMRSGKNLERSWVAAGTIQTDTGELFQIRQAGPGAVVVRQLDYESLPPEGEAIVPEEEMKPDEGEENVKATAAAHQIKVAAFYTRKARDAEGGTSQIKAVIDLAVSESNVAYSNSEVNARLSLVHSSMVTDSESGGFSGMLSALQKTSDGRMDSVHTTRNSVKADVVVLICDDSSSCGRAYRMATRSNSFKKWAFAVVNRNCATGHYSFSHEIGHILGGCHDAANPCSNPIYPYAYGWHFNIGISGEEVRTIMAYAPGRRIQHFSNPNVSIGIYKTGKANEADNARTFNNTAGTVAGFR